MATIPNVQRAWSPLAKPHCANAAVARKRVNILGALDYAANDLIYDLNEKNVNRNDVIEFIDRLAIEYNDGKLTVVVLDNASIHCNIPEEKIRSWMCDYQLILLHLPPYSPELNPIEILWKQAKYYWRKFTSWSKQDLLNEVNAIFQSYGEKFQINFA